jgi:phenylacetic acid degradation operon negative regulatory protein
MESISLHHPDINLTLLKRRSVAVLIDMLAWYGQAAATRGRSVLWSNCFPSDNAYRAAVHRLRAAGIVACRHGKDANPALLPAPHHARHDPLLAPHRLWDEKWNGWWYVLTYDVPESQRRFRDGLRRSLAHLGVGQLQKSVWISPRDIRAVYDDLHEATGVKVVSYLLEARTVLGRRSEDLVRAAWDFEAIDRRHRWYTGEYGPRIERLISSHPSRETAGQAAREELMAYRAAMGGDPLLPQKLLPPTYKGRTVFEVHRRLVGVFRRLL